MPKLVCNNCQKEFIRSKSDLSTSKKRSNHYYCSHQCRGEYKTKHGRSNVVCKQCGQIFSKKNNEITRTKNNFCSRSCSATYNNQNKSKGTRRSKLEQYIEKELLSLYPSLEILFNDREAINSELDIFIPSLKLAFELNGIFHYEPIYGQDKLDQIQNNDDRKFQACLEQGIELCIIDTSTQKYFKEKTSKRFLSIIINLIEYKLE